MLLTISTNHPNSTDIGYLLHKHPDKMQTFKLSFGDCHVFYPEAKNPVCTVCLLLDVDSVDMVRGNRRDKKFTLGGYVNDRPFVASSFMSVAISKVFGSALSGNCKIRPELIEQEFPFHVTIDVLPSKEGEQYIRKIFEPLGYTVQAEAGMLDDEFPEWGASRYFSLELYKTTTLQTLLNHLYVLIPVFDNQKHYFVGRDELDKLLSKGKGWLESHPEKESIARRYLKYQSNLFREALAQLSDGDIDENESSPDGSDSGSKEFKRGIEPEISRSLHDQRLDFVCEQLIECGATRVIDLGCGEGKLLRRLVKHWQFKEIVGTDVATRSLEIAKKRLRLDELPTFQADRVRLIHGSLMYRDSRFAGFDAAAIVEVIEHLDPPRLSAFERVVFRHARPSVVVVTTPNSEYNVMWPTLGAGEFRHSDHRFEWSREQFRKWAEGICERFGYSVTFKDVGPVEDEIGAPTQMGVFEINGRSNERNPRDASSESIDEVLT